MIAPGMTISATQRVSAATGAGTTPAVISNGIGFMANGALAIDTNAPAGNNYEGPIRMSNAGAIYGTTSTGPTDVFTQGILVSASGQLIYEFAVGTQVLNGNPLTANGVLACV